MITIGHLCCSQAATRQRMVWLLVMTFAGVNLWSAPPPSDQAAKQAKKEKKPPLADFENELFKGLNSLPQGVKSAGEKNTKPQPSETERGPAIDVDQQRRLTQGEDVGASPQAHSWLRIGHSMRNVEGRIAAGNLGKETQQLQKTIVQDLTELMKQFRQQTSKSSFRPGTGAAAEAGSQAAENQQEVTKPATDSSQRVGQERGSRVVGEETRMSREELWGRLPVRIQTQLRGAAVDQFLPKYERLLEQFYRQLADQADHDR